MLRTERFRIFLGRHLIEHKVTLILLPDVLPDGRFVQPYCADIVAYAPEFPTTKLVLQLCKAIEDHQGTLAFQIPHHTRHRILRRDAQQHMDVVWHQMSFDNIYPFVIT